MGLPLRGLEQDFTSLEKYNISRYSIDKMIRHPSVLACLVHCKQMVIKVEDNAITFVFMKRLGRF